MSDETFPISLGGRRGELPPLPFRAIMAIQPALFQVYLEVAGDGGGALSEAQIERLARSTWRAISEVERDFTYEEFLSLRFTVTELIAAFPSVAKATGLRAGADPATPEASPSAGKSTSTA